MDEFSVISKYFSAIACVRKDVIFGIGDDAACLELPLGMQLLVSCDTLIADVHFHSSWDAYDIAYKAVMVNVSDIAAMGGTPAWLTLALSVPSLDLDWLQKFSYGLRDALSLYGIALIGGDTTRSTLSMTLTIHGLVATGRAIRRNTAKARDKIYVSGMLGAAAFALSSHQYPDTNECERDILMKKLYRPQPRIDLGMILQDLATAAIDISDGLLADLNHICVASVVGARLQLDDIPVHPLLKRKDSLDFALYGGDDYELCFTVAPENEEKLLLELKSQDMHCYCIGVLEAKLGLRGWSAGCGEVVLEPRGYNHFKY